MKKRLPRCFYPRYFLVMLPKKDSLYAHPVAQFADFSFDATVVQVFPDMINRSVPGYATIIHGIGLLADYYTSAKGRCYDLGCSLGAASLSMQAHISAPDCKIIAVDNSPAMIAQFQQHYRPEPNKATIEIQCADIRDIEMSQASVVVVNFTLQFIPIADRLIFLSKIYQSLLPGGVLILSEKLCFSDPQQQQLQTDMHHAFKKAQGYSALEISQKRQALENVLLPETLQTHQARLQQAGFRSAEVWFAYFNFASLIALK